MSEEVRSALSVLDYIAVGVGVIVGISALVLTLSRSNRVIARLVSEVVFEAASLIWLGISIILFVDEVGKYNGWIHLAVSALYATAGIGFICFVISTALTAIRGPKDRKQIVISMGLSWFSWIVYLEISFVAFLVYLPVRGAAEETSKRYADFLIPFQLGVPFGITCLVFICLILQFVLRRCLRKKVVILNDLLLKVVSTIFCFLIILSPFIYLFRDIQGQYVRDTVMACVEICTALLHRLSISRLERELGWDVSYNPKEREADHQ